MTKKDYYPLPKIDLTLDALEGSTWFSTLDLKSGYWQVDDNEAGENGVLNWTRSIAVQGSSFWTVQRTSNLCEANGYGTEWTVLVGVSCIFRRHHRARA